MSEAVLAQQPRASQQDESRPAAFLVGPARSGTSLLYKALCLHPDAAYISNWLRRFPGLPALAAANRIAPRLPAVRRSVWFGDGSNAYVYGRRRSLARRAFPMPVEGEPVFAHCGTPAQVRVTDPEQHDATAALRGAFDSIGRWDGGRIVISKRIANNWRIPWLVAAFPDARFVSIVRDGRAVAYSLSRVDWWEDNQIWWRSTTPRQWREEGRDPWELCAQHWVDELEAVEAGLARVAPSQLLQVRYEEFIEDPLGALGRVAAFLGMGPVRPWLQELGQLRFPDRNERWRQELPAPVQATIERIQRAALADHGYVC